MIRMREPLPREGASMNHIAHPGVASLRAKSCIPLPVDNEPRRIAASSETTISSCDGHTFSMRRTGSGAPILLLHDMAATQDAWDPIRAALSWSHTVCTWDARGHGTSRGTPESAVPTLDLLAADLDAAIDACAPQPAVLVGHGLGALTILEYLRNYDAGRVSRVVLVDQSPRMLTVPDWQLGLFGGFRAADAQEFEAQIRANFAEAWLSLQARGVDAIRHAQAPPRSRPPESLRVGLRQLATGSMLALWHSMIGRDYRVDLAMLQIPLLAVLGGASNFYDTAQLGRWFQASVPHVQVVRYAEADHAPQAAAPARFARDIAAFAARPDRVAQRHEVAANGEVAPNEGGTSQPAPVRRAEG